MQKLSCFFVLLFLAGICPAQTYFSNHYDINYASETGIQISRSGDKIVVLTGALCRVDTGGFGACVELLRIDEAGTLLWEVLLDTMDVIYASNLITTDTAIYFAGPKGGDNRFGIHMMQFDWEGQLVREINLTEQFPHSSINHLSMVDTTLVLTFNKRGGDSPLGIIPDTTYYYFMDEQLEYERHHKISSGDYRFEVGFGYHKAKDGSGYYSDRYGTYSTWLTGDYLDILKFDEEGNLLWTYTEEEEGDNARPDIITTDDGGLVVLWSIDNFNFEDTLYPYPSILIKVNKDGVLDWKLTLSSFYLKNTIRLFPASNGDIMCVGINDLSQTPYNIYESNSLYVGWLARISQEGELLWERNIYDDRFIETFPVMDFHHGLSMPDGGFMLVGDVKSPYPPDIPGLGHGDTWVVRTDSLGCVNPGCEEVDVISGAEFFRQTDESSFIIYPNPAQERVVVDWEVFSQRPVNVEIYNAIGQQVYRQRTSFSRLNIDISHWMPGVYYISLRDQSGRRSIQKLIKQQ